MGNNKTYIDLMIDSLNKKASILEEIVSINLVQRKIADGEKFDMDAFDETIEQKAGLIEEINKLDGGFESLYDRVKGELLDNGEAYSAQIANMQMLIKKITELSATIETDEKRIKANLEVNFSKIKQSIKETRKNSKAVSNYYKNMSKLDSEPQFMDKKK